MKDFLKYVLATIVGLFATGLIMGLLLMMSIVGIVASDSATKRVEDNSVFVLNLNGGIAETADNNPFAALLNGGDAAVGLNDLLSAIKKAKANEDVKGIYLDAGSLSAGFATLKEVRDALVDFKTSGKWIVAYADSYSQAGYYMASVADKILLNPQGSVDIHGLASQPFYIKDLCQKFGVKYQVVKVGTYKSATEMYTEDHMSDANREQMSAIVNGAWDVIVKDMAKSRKLNADSLNAYADRLIALEPTDNMLKYKLVDKLVFADKVKDEVKAMLGLEEDDSIEKIGLAEMLNVPTEDEGDDEIAVYYMQGDIVQSAGFASPAFGGNGPQIVAETVCKDLENLMNDDDVKAVVLRVNSGGGDAYASEQIWHMVTELKAKKPVVVSMGDYAASGAYYLSCNASYVFAQPNTLTGSIGIFGVIPDMSQLVTEKLGVKFDEVKTNRNSTFGNMAARSLNEEELSLLNGRIRNGYELFRKRVVDGRKLTVDHVESIAQGHVWIGSDALGIKLVDALGSLDDAVKKAAELAKVDSYFTSDYPGEADFFDQILEANNGNDLLDSHLRLTLGTMYEPFMFVRQLNEQPMIQARMPYWCNIK